MSTSMLSVPDPRTSNPHRSPSRGAAGSEREPLLRGRRSSTAISEEGGESDKLPYTQLVLICLWRASNPLMSETCLVFLAPLLIDELKVADAKSVGYKSGYIQSIASIAICIGIFPGAWLSDTIGRKPVIISALFLGGMAQLFFAFAANYSQLIVARLLVGLAGSFLPANIKTMAVEISTEATAPIFFAVMSLGWQAASMLAPALGGILSRPAEIFPIFRGTIFESHPYALPSVVTAIIPMATAVAGIFLGKETLTAERRKNISRIAARTKALPQKAAQVQGMLTKSSSFILFIWVQMIFLICAFNSIQVLFFYSPRALGGLALSPREMAFFFMLRPLLLVGYEVTVYPIMAKKLGPETIMKYMSYCYVVSYSIFLGLSYLASTEIDQKWLTVGLVITIFVNVCANPIFIAADQLIAARAPSQAHIAKINAFAELLANLAGGLGFAFGSNLSALSVEKNLLGGRLMWVVLVVLSIIQWISCQRITKEKSWRDDIGRERRFNPNTARRLSTVSFYTGS